MSNPELLSALTLNFETKEITLEEFRLRLKEEHRLDAGNVRFHMRRVIRDQDAEGVENGLTILSVWETANEFIDILHNLIVEPWHREHENIVHDLQFRKDPSSIPFIEEAMIKRYDYLEAYGTGTRQFINQCGHALRSIGTPKAILVIQKLAQSDDVILADEMKYRLSRVQGRDDYERADD